MAIIASAIYRMIFIMVFSSVSLTWAYAGDGALPDAQAKNYELEYRKIIRRVFGTGMYAMLGSLRGSKLPEANKSKADLSLSSSDWKDVEASEVEEFFKSSKGTALYAQYFTYYLYHRNREKSIDYLERDFFAPVPQAMKITKQLIASHEWINAEQHLFIRDEITRFVIVASTMSQLNNIRRQHRLEKFAKFSEKALRYFQFLLNLQAKRVHLALNRSLRFIDFKLKRQLTMDLWLLIIGEFHAQIPVNEVRKFLKKGYKYNIRKALEKGYEYNKIEEAFGILEHKPMPMWRSSFGFLSNFVLTQISYILLMPEISSQTLLAALPVSIYLSYRLRNITARLFGRPSSFPEAYRQGNRLSSSFSKALKEYEMTATYQVIRLSEDGESLSEIPLIGPSYAYISNYIQENLLFPNPDMDFAEFRKIFKSVIVKNNIAVRLMIEELFEKSYMEKLQNMRRTHVSDEESRLAENIVFLEELAKLTSTDKRVTRFLKKKIEAMRKELMAKSEHLMDEALENYAGQEVSCIGLLDPARGRPL